MKIRQLLELQKVIEKREISFDLDNLLNLTYYSKSKMELLNIGDMHLTHFVRVFAKMLTSNDSPLQNEIDKMRERLDEIEKENKNGYTN